MKQVFDCCLYTFIDTAYLNGREVTSVAQQLCDGGSDIIQLRAKEPFTLERGCVRSASRSASNSQSAAAGSATTAALRSHLDEIRRMAEIILPITRRAGVPLVVNDHLQIAQEIGAEFCHLGQEDFFGTGNAERGTRNVSELKIKNSKLKIGLSTHAPSQAERAIAAGADYVAIGPIYATGTKPTAKPVTLDYVRWAAANVKIPWFAIGGINLQTVDDVLAAGAKRICVVSAILNSENIAQTCREFRARLK